jgi:hypothetical protein
MFNGWYLRQNNERAYGPNAPGTTTNVKFHGAFSLVFLGVLLCNESDSFIKSRVSYRILHNKIVWGYPENCINLRGLFDFSLEKCIPTIKGGGGVKGTINTLISKSI